jgi:hypothetical protein
MAPPLFLLIRSIAGQPVAAEQVTPGVSTSWLAVSALERTGRSTSALQEPMFSWPSRPQHLLDPDPISRQPT